ncbi:hypothetical protein [Hydrogenophaga sp.]|uniref:type IV pilus assembly protein FimV n=1 Tax=Hydrogenophaga sp. TaxID=1904254 RepID=UPI002AC98806|nr:hypothetical protein [Hydrogenophaga sp.]
MPQQAMTKYSNIETRKSAVRQIWVGCILLSTAVSSTAVTLGRHTGAAIIGRPLDVRVQLFLASGEDFGNLCVGSDVFYGDSQVPSSQVRSTLQKSAIEAEGYVRVQSLQPVNEPIVTVYVRASCTAPFTRRFVLLADPITEPSVQVGSSPGPSAESRLAEGSRFAPERLPSVNPTRAGGAAFNAEPAASSTAEPPVARAQAPKPLAEVQPAQLAAPPEAKPEPPVVRPPRPKPPSVVRRPAAPSPEPTSRLQLEPLDLGPIVERDPVLKMSISLLSEPTASDETRAAATLLWNAINASPEDVLRDAQKLAALESESKNLRDVATQSEAAMTELRGQLETAQTEKFMNWLVYLLGGALVLALLAVGFLWRRRYQASGDEAAKIWWASEIKPNADAMPLKSAPMPVDVKPELVPDTASPLGAGKPKPGIPTDSRKALDSGFPFNDNSRVPMLNDKDRSDFAHSSTLGASRSFATEELFDVQQKADFFTSLGKDEEAIEVLLSHLNESLEPCALTYLDLLNIYHRLGRKEEYERLRAKFNQMFNAGAPDFEQYSDEGQGLEAYETAMGRIQALWPQPQVLDLLEQSIFRDPMDFTPEVFDLEAYRELLLLHAIAKDVITREAVAPSALVEFQHTAVQPLKVKLKAQPKAQAKAPRSFGAVPTPNTEPFELDLMPPVPGRVGLDIDLTELSKESSFAVLLPEAQTSEQSSVPIHVQALPRAVRSAPLSEPNPFETFDFTIEEQDLSSGKLPGKSPSE